MLGALTPTEVVRALDEAADAIKIFPVSSGGGASHVKALKSVFPDICLCPTGGISVGNITAYFDAGADFVGVGGQLVDQTALLADDKSRVTKAAQAALVQVEQARV
jgi:2-dehydro-3-deoxyphosphogluconate aldolase/(4S)-4-hydroxy-2-oxoglutarate aldolase